MVFTQAFTFGQARWSKDKKTHGDLGKAENGSGGLNSFCEFA